MSSIHPALPTTEYDARFALLAIDRIRTDGGTQSRAQLDWIAINDYAAAMRKGDTFPPIVVFHDGEAYWLADGFHRVNAAGYADLIELAADVRQGTLDDAILHSVQANHHYGVRRTPADKRRAVELLLNNAVWGGRSANWIAEQCGVSHPFVLEIKSQVVTLQPDATVVGKDGKRQPGRKARKPVPTPDPEPTALSFDQPIDEPASEPESVALPVPRVVNADARRLTEHVTEPVHLVVTSPPYNVGIEYGQHNDNLATYFEWLKSIWSECHAVMADGARIAVVVPFGVGRNPWTPFACQIMGTLTDVGFTLRGQIIWDKNTSGNRTSWGSFRMSSDPSLRDTTEAIVIAHKGDSKLTLPVDLKLQDDKGTFIEPLADSTYFMELAQDHWIVASPESASRVKHPAPFPVELVKRLIDFYAYPGAHILDPFGGSGTTGIAARRCGCPATLIEIDADYCRLAEERLANHGNE